MAEVFFERCEDFETGCSYSSSAFSNISFDYALLQALGIITELWIDGCYPLFMHGESTFLGCFYIAGVIREEKQHHSGETIQRQIFKDSLKKKYLRVGNPPYKYADNWTKLFV